MNDYYVIKRPTMSSQKKVDLTVVVPTSNTAAYLPSCLASLAYQTGLRLELIVIDFHSIDRSIEIACNFSREHPDILFTMIRQNTPGLGNARNIGIDLAIGDYIAFLDSDDFFAPDGYSQLVHYARNHHCDLMFCRANVFDDATHETYPFYDDWVWDAIIGNRSHMTTTAEYTPELFKFEPNASLRIMRREFMLKREIRYPEGKRAEDLIPHYRSLFEAQRIGLLSDRFFFYRVGRAGKLTSDPSKWIGDLVDATAHVISESSNYSPSPDIGASMIYLWVRSLFGYGTKLPYLMRGSYFTTVSLLFQQLPQHWISLTIDRRMHPNSLEDFRMKLALLALRRRDIEFLVFLCGKPRSFSALSIQILKRIYLLISLKRIYGRSACKPAQWKKMMRMISH